MNFGQVFSKNRSDRGGFEQSEVNALAVSGMLMVAAKHRDPLSFVNCPLKGSSLELNHRVTAIANRLHSTAQPEPHQTEHTQR